MIYAKKKNIKIYLSFNAIFIKIPTMPSISIIRLILKFYVERCRPKDSSTIMKKKNKEEESLYLMLKLYYYSNEGSGSAKKTHRSVQQNRELRSRSTQICSTDS